MYIGLMKVPGIFSRGCRHHYASWRSQQPHPRVNLTVSRHYNSENWRSMTSSDYWVRCFALTVFHLKFLKWVSFLIFSDFFLQFLFFKPNYPCEIDLNKYFFRFYKFQIEKSQKIVTGALEPVSSHILSWIFTEISTYVRFRSYCIDLKETHTLL